MRLAPAAEVFVGRELELAALTAWLAGIRTPRAGVATVVGEAGVGKSTLLGRSLQDWEDSGGLLLAGGGVSIPGLEGLNTPFGVFAEALRGAAMRQDLNPRGLERVKRWLESSRRSGELDPTPRRHEELLEILQLLSSDWPVVLAVEDLHWVDASSLGALVFLARQLGSEPVGIVVTSRKPVSSDAHPPFDSVVGHRPRPP